MDPSEMTQLQTMTDDELLDLLKRNSEAIAIESHRISISERAARFDLDGEFRPDTNGGKITLNATLEKRKQVIVLCHELGHFWSHARGRCAPEMKKLLMEWQLWKNDIHLRTRNRSAIIFYQKEEDIPHQLWKKIVDEEMTKRPLRMSEHDKRLIIADEIEAWNFALALVESIDPCLSTGVKEASKRALRSYYEQLQLPSIDEVVLDVDQLALSPEDWRYIFELTKGGQVTVQ